MTKRRLPDISQLTGDPDRDYGESPFEDEDEVADPHDVKADLDQYTSRVYATKGSRTATLEDLKERIADQGLTPEEYGELYGWSELENDAMPESWTARMLEAGERDILSRDRKHYDDKRASRERLEEAADEMWEFLRAEHADKAQNPSEVAAAIYTLSARMSNLGYDPKLYAVRNPETFADQVAEQVMLTRDGVELPDDAPVSAPDNSRTQYGFGGSGSMAGNTPPEPTKPEGSLADDIDAYKLNR